MLLIARIGGNIEKTRMSKRQMCRPFQGGLRLLEGLWRLVRGGLGKRRVEAHRAKGHEKTIFDCLKNGEAPEKITGELGHMYVVDRYFQKWRGWRMDDCRKSLAKLRQLAPNPSLHSVEYSISNGISELGEMLASLEAYIDSWVGASHPKSSLMSLRQLSKAFSTLGRISLAIVSYCSGGCS